MSGRKERNGFPKMYLQVSQCFTMVSLSSNENNETNMKRNHYLHRARDGNTNAWVPFKETPFT